MHPIFLSLWPESKDLSQRKTCKFHWKLLLLLHRWPEMLLDQAFQMKMTISRDPHCQQWLWKIWALVCEWTLRLQKYAIKKLKAYQKAKFGSFGNLAAGLEDQSISYLKQIKDYPFTYFKKFSSAFHQNYLEIRNNFTMMALNFWKP